MLPYHLSDGQWIHLFANAKAEGKMDDQEARGREEYMDHRQTEKNEKNYWRMRHLFSFLLFGLLSIDP